MLYKNKKWFRDFEEGNYKNLYYVEGGHVYYDLIVQFTEEYQALPVPIFSKKYLDLEIDGMESDFGHYERAEIRKYLNSVADYSVISDDEYEMLKEEFRIRREDEKFLATLSDEEKELLENVDLVLERTENQFGESVPTEWIRGTMEDGYELVYVACWASSNLGFGTCNCANHPIHESEPISAQEALELVREHYKKGKI